MNGSINFTSFNTTSPTFVTTTTLSLQQVLFVSILTYVDYVNRVVSFSMFIIYFTAVAMFKEMRTPCLLYVHHANFVGFIFVLMYIIYFSTSAPNSTSPYLNDLLCRITEVVWGIVKYLRSYSLTLIAVYRLTAVYFRDFFKVINRTYFSIMLPILLLWITATAVFFATRYGFNTTYGALYCIDGYSTNFDSTVDYLIVSSLLSIVVPFSVNFVIFCFIRIKLSKLSGRAGIRRMTSIEMSALKSRVSIANNESSTQYRSSVSIKTERVEMHKNKRFNLQLIALNTCDIMCFAMSFILSFRYIIVDFNQKFYYFRQLLRIFNIFFQAMIPVLSLYFNPNISFSNMKAFFSQNIKCLKRKVLK